MSDRKKQPRSDALVLFGASGDLAHKKIFPALYAMSANPLAGTDGKLLFPRPVPAIKKIAGWC
jgi:glucose-6-phosphate 1-dehydrogenase